MLRKSPLLALTVVSAIAAPCPAFAQTAGAPPPGGPVPPGRGGKQLPPFCEEPVASPEVDTAKLNRQRRNTSGAGDDDSEMGADLSGGVDHRRPVGFYRRLDHIRRYRALPVLRVRRDLPGAPHTRAHDIQGAIVLTPRHSGMVR